MKLKSKKFIQYKGEVIDLCVENSHTYNVEGIAVHNSAGGSLAAYVLYITDLDPIKWDLPFARFLSVHRCLDPETYVLLSDNTSKKIKNITCNDVVLSTSGNHCKVLETVSSKHSKIIKVTIGNQIFRCSENHRWLVLNKNNEYEEKFANQLTVDDSVYLFQHVTKKIDRIEYDDIAQNELELIDLTIDVDHTFWMSVDNENWVATHNSGSPDIDCVDSKHLVVMADASYKCAGDILVGEQVLGGDNKPHVVSATYERSLRENEKAISLFVLANQETLGHMCVVPQHKFVKVDGTICYAKDLKIDDELMASCSVRVISMKYLDENIVRKFVDITVEDDHRFHIIPFNVVELGNGLLGTPFDYQRGE